MPKAKTATKKTATKTPSKIYDTKTILNKLVSAIEKSAALDSTRDQDLAEVKEELSK